MTKEMFAKALKVVDKPSNVKIDIRLCTSAYACIYRHPLFESGTKTGL